MTFHAFRIRAGVTVLALLSAVLRWSDAPAAQEIYRFAPAPQWVMGATPDYNAPEPTGQTSNGSWLLALDRQINVTAAGDDRYQYVVTKVATEAGIEEQSQINLDVDPSYQTVDIHFLRVRRGATSIDARATARITALPQETQLRERIYNGGYNINILFADVRAGDVIEYAYTTHSRETLFPGHYAAQFVVAWSEPVHWQRVRIRAPLDRPLRARSSDGSAVPEFSVRGPARELLMEWHDLASIPDEENRPTWYTPWPRLYVSDFKDWAEVARAIDPLYSAAKRATASVASVAREIAAGGGSREEIALRALQYVQEQVSYVSIAIGHGGYQPARPDTVLERRYGDCKDKSVLLVSLLRELGIEAQPALVHTRRGRILTGMLPSPFLFDHAIARVQIGDKFYWVDGTAVKQYTPLSVDAPPDFENALLVGSASDRLVPIPRPSADSHRKDIDVTVDLSAGFDKPGKLTVITRYHGPVADDVRGSLGRKSAQQRLKDYLDYTTRYYPSAKSAGPLQIEDNKAQDILQIREIYTLASPFADNKKQWVLNLHADELYRYSEAISTAERRAPLALDYPLSIRQHVTALMPEPWPVDADKVHVDNPAFRYQSDVSSSDRKVELTYEYKTLKDEVAPEAMTQYLADRKAFDGDLGFVLRHDKVRKTAVAAKAEKKRSPLLLGIFFVAMGAALWLLRRPLSRWNPEPRAAETSAPRGIAGWLLLPALSTVLAPFVTMLFVFDRVLSTPTGAWQAAPTQMALTAMCAMLFVAQVTAVPIFFGRRTSAPALFIAVAWLTVVYSIGLDAWTANTRSPEASVAFVVGYGLGSSYPAIAGALLWTIYMNRSQRVRATFVERYRQPPTVLALFGMIGRRIAALRS